MTSIDHSHMPTSRRRRRRKTFLAAFCVVFLALCMVVSCSRHDVGGQSSEDEARILRLRQMDDSITAMSPTIGDTIRKAISSAPDSITYYEYTLRLTRLVSLSSEPERCLPYLDRVVSYARREMADPASDVHKERLNALLGGAYNCHAAYLHNFHRSTDETIRLYTSAYECLSHSDSKHNMPVVCANLADAYQQNNDVPNAAKWYRRALFLVDSLKLPKKENVTLYMGLAQIYLSLHDFETALSYYDQTERYFDLMSPSMQGYYLNNLGNLLYFKKDYSRALDTFLRMKRNIARHGMQDNFDMYLCKINLADVYLNLDSVATSLRYLDEVEPYFRKQGDPTAIYYCNTIRIGIASRMGKASEVGRILRNDTSSSCVPFAMVNLRDEYLQRYYEQVHDYRKAYLNLKASVTYNDSLEHNRSNMRSAEIMARFTSDTLKLHHDLVIEHKNADIQRANQTLTIAASLVVVMLLVLALCFVYYKKKRFETQMNIMNLKLNIVRNRISPHFVFNVLNNKIVNSDKAEASELLELTRLIRANLDMSRAASVTLKEELSFVEQYIRVERYLLGDDFDFRLNVAPDVRTDDIRVPSMFLQILTENAIIHGLKGREGHKMLHIGIRRQAAVTIVSVEDNGPGFNAFNGSLKKKTGLGIISQTVAANNEHNKKKMRFEIRNNTDSQGVVTGCIATLRVPDGVKFQ